MLVTREFLHGLIKEEIDAGIPSERIVLGGFSQGGAMSLFTGLTGSYKLGGIVGMSSYLPLDDKLPQYLEKSNLNQKTPILMCHGDVDNVVPARLGRETYELLKKIDFDVNITMYP